MTNDPNNAPRICGTRRNRRDEKNGGYDRQKEVQPVSWGRDERLPIGKVRKQAQDNLKIKDEGENQGRSLDKVGVLWRHVIEARGLYSCVSNDDEHPKQLALPNEGAEPGAPPRHVRPVRMCVLKVSWGMGRKSAVLGVSDDCIERISDWGDIVSPFQM